MPKATTSTQAVSQMEPLKRLQLHITMRLGKESLTLRGRKHTFVESYAQSTPALN